jgi:hypothetical protein
LRENSLSKLSPAGTAESSPGRESWVSMRQRAVPQGRLKIPQDAILGDSISEMDYSRLGQPTQDPVLGHFQPSLRDYSVARC